MDEIELEQFEHWKKKVLLTGGLAGIVVGLLTALMLVRSAEKNGRQTPEIRPVDLLGTIIAIIGVVRGIASLGSEA